MQHETHSAHGRRGIPGTPRTGPSSSRMLASYLIDIEQLLDEQRWDAALRDARDLPRIAVSLSDPELRASSQAITKWCETWMDPPETDSSESKDCSPAALVTQESSVSDASSAVPTRALRRLRLHRHARTLPRGFRLDPDENLDPEAATAAKSGRALVESARRWYARSGVHDLTVQDNLARLAVLR
jgi:hypothetical protein